MHLLYEGPSQIDGQPIVCLLTGLDRPSQNKKTGLGVLQTWILRQDISPTNAVKNKEDYSICGNCPHRGTSCYVNVGQSPTSVWNAYKRGNYKIENLKKLGFRRHIRLGSYGDPSAIPILMWDDLLQNADGFLGYTHHPLATPDLKKYCQASADSEEQATLYQNLGFKTFRVKAPAAPTMPNEIMCKSPTLTCATCRLCDGQQKNIAIDVHGLQYRQNHFLRRQNDQANELELLESTDL